ncbi:sulfatase-like hydrolase/transferase, partial [bacterium]|nr:sulfatase-like hydrolase/transferase [bacterium]
PHGPYDPPPPYDFMYDPSYTGDSDGNWYALSPEGRRDVTEDPRELRHFSARYAGEVSYADLHVGRLIGTLERMGVLDRTLVVFTSDHGESLTEHGYYFGHGDYLYEPSLSVPLIFRLPDSRGSGSRRTELVTLADIQPTVLEFLAMGTDGDVDGQSLVGLCLSSDRVSGIGPRVVYSALHRGETRDDQSLLSLRTPRHKYIRASSYFDGQRTVPQLEELYDLSEDPAETIDLAIEEPDLLRAFRASADPHWIAWLTSDRGQPAPLSEESREALRALGYVE